MAPRIWVVVDRGDRQVMEVCDSRSWADKRADALGADVDEYPLSTDPGTNAWLLALQRTKDLAFNPNLA